MDFKKNTILRRICVFVIVIVVTVTAFFSCNEYFYNKIGDCFAEENFALAKNYLNSLSSGYRDTENIRSLLQIIETFDEENEKDSERAVSLLTGFGGFENKKINLFYNSFYIKAALSLKEKKLREEGTEHDAVTNTDTSSTEKETDTVVYFLEESLVYHLSESCYTIKESQNILTGPVPEGRRVCKVCQNN